MHTIDVTVPIQLFDDFNLPKFYTWQIVTAFEKAVLDYGFPSEDQTTYLLISENDRYVFRHGSGEFLALKHRICPKIEYASDRVVKPGEVILGNNQGLCAKIAGNWNIKNPIHKPVPAIVDNRIDVRMGYDLPNRFDWSNRYFFRYQLAVALSAILASGWKENSTSIASNDEIHIRMGTFGGGMIGAYMPDRLWESRVDFLGSSPKDEVHIWNHTTHAVVTAIGDWINV